RLGPARRRDRPDREDRHNFREVVASDRPGDHNFREVVTIMTTRMFGEPIARLEDPRLVSGDGRYLDDLGRDALAAAFVRSPYAHARVLDVDVTETLDVDGLFAVYTYEDLDGRVAEPLPLLIPHPALHAPRTGYPLARDTVRHVGEAVAMVVA